MTWLLPTTYVLYLGLGVAMTLWVARTLFRHGAPFLRDAFRGNTELADSVNHLLVVGFYLLNLGYLCVSLPTSTPPDGTAGALEMVSVKFGKLLMVLGAMHFLNLLVLSKLGRSRAVERWLPGSAAPAKP
jgi:hypothetical protein